MKFVYPNYPDMQMSNGYLISYGVLMLYVYVSRNLVILTSNLLQKCSYGLLLEFIIVSELMKTPVTWCSQPFHSVVSTFTIFFCSLSWEPSAHGIQCSIELSHII